jgi:hypothetical protein
MWAIPLANPTPCERLNIVGELTRIQENDFG